MTLKVKHHAWNFGVHSAWNFRENPNKFKLFKKKKLNK